MQNGSEDLELVEAEEDVRELEIARQRLQAERRARGIR